LLGFNYHALICSDLFKDQLPCFLMNEAVACGVQVVTTLMNIINWYSKEI
jgi:hypothetical protein